MFKKLFSKLSGKSDKKNIIMITIDQLRTDRLDKFEIFKKLKSRGIYFDNVITYAPYTIASMTAYFTGMYGIQNGVDAYYASPRFKKNEVHTLAQYFQDNGYYTCADYINEMMAPHQGFDKLLIHNEFKDKLIERHLGLLEEMKNGNRPYFLYLHFSTIHTMVVENIIHKFNDFDEGYFNPANRNTNAERYEGYIKYAADYLEKIMDFIDSNNTLENSILIFQTDHGCSLGEKSGELAYGVYCYDYTVKLWSIMIGKNLFPEGKKISTQTRTIDVMPTLMDIANISQDPQFFPIQGSSLIPVINGIETAHREAFIQTAPNHGPTQSPYKPNLKALRNGEWKLLYNDTTEKKELYNILKDPEENNNLAGMGMEIENELWAKLSRI
ncbi:MAG TPA: sulfatase-like hydrolase/transferase [bacterium]|nr:sulfatase-like hydrolase/transferase [bacterium]